MKQYIVAIKCTVLPHAMSSYSQSFSFSTRDTSDTRNRNYVNDLNMQNIIRKKTKLTGLIYTLL